MGVLKLTGEKSKLMEATSVQKHEITIKTNWQPVEFTTKILY